MTYRIKHRPLPGALVMAEYACPEHGRFEVLVERDENGDPPDRVMCGQLEYGIGGDFDAGQCSHLAAWTISAPQPKKDSVPCSAVTRGGDMKDRPPGMLDTRPLAEGMPMSEWRKVQKKHQEDRRHQQLIKNGLKTKRIQSP